MARAQKIGIEDRAESAAASMPRPPFLDATMARMLSWPVEAWLRYQAGMLKAAEPATAGWIERRRAAATATLDAFERLSGCNDLQEAALIQRSWFEESMKRLDSDLRALADQALAVSQEALSVTRYAAQSSAEAVAAIQPTPRGVEHTMEAAA